MWMMAQKISKTKNGLEHTVQHELKNIFPNNGYLKRVYLEIRAIVYRMPLGDLK